LHSLVHIARAHSHGSAAQGDGDVVVWLEPLDFMPPRQVTARDYTITQQDKRFHPHVLAVPVGTAVRFPNKDPWFHNVFSLYDGKRFDLGLYEAGSSRSVRFERPGVSFVFCNIHPEMSAYVLALDTPYFATSRSDGKVSIPNVEPGRYRLHVWYEFADSAELNRLSREITLPRDLDSVARLDVRESDRLVPQHADKHGKPYEETRPPY
jgi:plastocyanin